METKGSNLSEVMNRMVDFVNYMNEHEQGLGVLDRDVLLQQLRELYMMVLEMPVGMQAEPVAAVESEPESADPEPVEEPMLDEVPGPVGESEPAPAKEEPIVETSDENEAEEVEEPAFAPAEPEPEPEPAPEPVMEQIEGNPFENVFEEPEAAPEPIEAVEPEPEKESEPAPEPEPEPEPAPEPVKEERVQKHKKEERATEQPSLFDYLNTSTPSQFEQPTAPTLADKIGGNRQVLEEQLEHKVHPNKVSDLRTVININDKFSFVNELFHNNMKGYTDFILRLNSLETREEALAATAEMAEIHKWAEDSLAVRTFYKILDRKF